MRNHIALLRCTTAALAATLCSTTASANPAPTCSWSAPYFANAVPGDVLAYPTSEVQPLMQVVLNDTGQTIGHVAAIADSKGSILNESIWNGTAPSHGGCALPLDVNSLQNLQPGITQSAANGSNVIILKNDAATSCNYAYSSYKIHSYTSDIANGNCAHYLTSSCGVQSYNANTISYNAYAGNAANDLYNAAKRWILTEIPWYTQIPLFGCNVSYDQIGDRGAMQVLNEMFFGAGNQNYNYYANIHYEDANAWQASQSYEWPQYVNPGATPMGIFLQHNLTHGGTGSIGTGSGELTGQATTSTYSCGCPYGYAYNTNTGTCDAPTISFVYDLSYGTYNTGHPGSYISIYGSGFSPNNNVVWLGTTYIGATYQSPTQINSYLPANMPTGSQSLEVAIPGIGQAFATVNVIGAAAVCGNGTCESGENGSNCGQDCCDASTSCNQTKQNNGSQYCRNTNNAGYGWTGPLTCGSSVGYGSTSSCGGSTYNCCQSTNSWTTNSCGGGGGGGQTCSQYYCSTYGWSAGQCNSGYYCDGTCITYNGCTAGGGGGGGQTCSQYYCSTYGWTAGTCGSGWYCDGTCITYTGCQ